MLESLFKSTVRQAVRNFGLTIMNISGLTIGFAAGFLLILYALDEFSYNKFLPNSDNVYRVLVNEMYADGSILTSKSSMVPLKAALEKSIPEVEKVLQITTSRDLVLQYDKQGYSASGFMSSEEFFEVLSFTLLEVRRDVWSPNSIFLSESLASKMFSSSEAIGRVVQIPDWGVFTVDGVFEDPPVNSTFQFDFVMPIEHWLKKTPDAYFWENRFVRQFLLLDHNTDKELLAQKINDFYKGLNSDETSEIMLQSIEEEYLFNKYTDGKVSSGRIIYVRTFVIIATLIIVLACMNYVNVVTAMSSKRAKEIGIKKVIGSSRKLLVFQFLFESVLVTLCSGVLAMVIVYLALPFVNNLMDKSITIEWFHFAWLLSGGSITGILAGLYPSLVLSSLNLNTVLRGSFKNSGWAGGMRKGLLVFQFLISLMMIIGAFIVQKQLSFIKQMNLGYEKENLIHVPLKGKLKQSSQLELFKSQLTGKQGILSVTSVDNLPLNSNRSTTGGFRWEGKGQGLDVGFNILQVSHDFVQTLNLQLVLGRSFDKLLSSDQNNIIINEATAKVMGFENPLDKSVFFWGRQGVIVGVVKDFHFATVYEEIQPLIISLRPEQSRYLLVKSGIGSTEHVLNVLKASHASLAPSLPFEFGFMDVSYENLYRNEEKVNVIIKIFSMIAIFLSLLGVFSLSLFVIEQRSKEVAVRKVLGAAFGQLFYLLTKNFLFLVCLSFCFAAPLVYLVLDSWLDGFVYRIGISSLVFVLGGLVLIGVTFLTISYHTVAAVLMNPINKLRQE